MTTTTDAAYQRYLTRMADIRKANAQQLIIDTQRRQLAVEKVREMRCEHKYTTTKDTV